MKKSSLVVTIILTAVILLGLSPASMALEVVVTDIYDQLGIQPASDQHRDPGEKTGLMAVVRDPSKLASFGVSGLESGDAVRLTNFVSNLWNVTHLKSGKSLNVRLKTADMASVQPLMGGRR